MAKHFKLTYNYTNPTAAIEALKAADEYIAQNPNSNIRLTVKDMVKGIDPKKYDKLTRGDKCRIGKEFSDDVDQNKRPEVKRSKKKGCTNTYIIL